MGITHSTPQYNATRRIKWLFFAVIVTTLVAIVAWFAIANVIDKQLKTGLQQHRQTGGVARCDNQDVRGFPFRFGVFCNAASYGDDRFAVETGAIRSAAQFYSPNHIIVEIDGPLALRTDSQTITVNWETARAGIHRASPLPRRASLEMRQPIIQAASFPTLSAQSLTGHMRALRKADDRGGEAGDIDIATQIIAPQFAAFLSSATNVADINVELDATMKQAAARFEAGERQTLLAGAAITLHRLAFVLDDDSGILLDGALTTDRAGRLSGEIDVRLIDVDAVMSVLNDALPDHQSLIGLLANLPKSGINNDETTLTLSLNEGRMSFGLIPLGTLAPLL